MTTLQGIVKVNRGGGYQTVPGSTEVAPGASVMADPGGSAKIIYADGCTVQVLPGAVVTVAAQPPCLVTGATEPAPGMGTGISDTTLAIGGVALVGGVVGSLSP